MDVFRTRFGLLATLLGMAIGTGNIWRFPRMLAQHGGAFLIPWAIFLVCWSLPLLMVEFSLGKSLRRGVLGSFSILTGGRWAWCGGFVVCCTLGIMCYYSVITGWCLYYAGAASVGPLLAAEPQRFWEAFSGSGFLPWLFHLLCLGGAAWVVGLGIQRGIERVNRWMIPALCTILAILAGAALTVPGSERGLSLIFTIEWARLADARTWLDALTQSAWSTGAGWGLALTYACYARDQDNPVTTPLITGLGNNAIELLAAVAIIPPLFAYFEPTQAAQIVEEGNTGLTFISLPALFQGLPHGRWLAPLFFIGLFLAAFTSLIAMYELGVRFLRDAGFSRSRGILITGLSVLLLGSVSAWNMQILENQDWVWGLGLLVSGFFFTLLAGRVGAARLWTEFMSRAASRWTPLFAGTVRWLLPAEFLALLGWWFWQSVHWHPQDWYHPLRTFSVGTCLLQWGILLVLLGLANRTLSRRVTAARSTGAFPEGQRARGPGGR